MRNTDGASRMQKEALCLTSGMTVSAPQWTATSRKVNLAIPNRWQEHPPVVRQARKRDAAANLIRMAIAVPLTDARAGNQEQTGLPKLVRQPAIARKRQAVAIRRKGSLPTSLLA